MDTMPSAPATIDFTLGSRRLLSVGRNLAPWAFSLEDVLAQPRGTIAPPAPGRDGLRILSAPQTAISEITACFPHHLIGGRQDYRRHYIDMRAGKGCATYDDYIARFSGKTRSTLRRKARKLSAELGEYTISQHQCASEIETFLEAALPLSAKTYQARLLAAGLPDTDAARQSMLEAAERDQMRCYLISTKGQAIAYLALPIVGRTLVYAHLGYDPDHARLSPGTVLQMHALEKLFAEQRFDYFDFTEGEGAHKAMFGTHWAACSSFVLLDPTLTNRALLGARATFDGAVGTAKTLAERSGTLSRMRAVLRR